MLPSEKATEFHYNISLTRTGLVVSAFGNSNNQHIYMVSMQRVQNGDLKAGDVVYHAGSKGDIYYHNLGKPHSFVDTVVDVDKDGPNGNEIVSCKRFNFAPGVNNVFKVTASSDRELTPLSWLDLKFAHAYAREYDNNRQIREAVIKFEDDSVAPREDGSVVVHRARSFSMSDMIEALKKYNKEMCGNRAMDEDIESWAETLYNI